MNVMSTESRFTELHGMIPLKDTLYHRAFLSLLRQKSCYLEEENPLEDTIQANGSCSNAML